MPQLLFLPDDHLHFPLGARCTEATGFSGDGGEPATGFAMTASATFTYESVNSCLHALNSKQQSTIL